MKVCGEFACWTRPEHKVERVSYECMTPSAARNILDAICWKPQMRWIVDRILVLKPIRFMGIRRNELQNKLHPRALAEWLTNPEMYIPQPAGAGTKEATLRNTAALCNVAYIIEAFPHIYHPMGDDTPLKYIAMFQRRVEKGQCFQRPYLGCREFAADFMVPGPADMPLPISLPLGRMLYDLIYDPERSGNRAVFFEASLVNGVLQTHPDLAIADQQLRREVVECSYGR